MNKIQSYFWVVLCILLLPISACEDEFTELNTDPNNPTEVPNSLLLPSAETFFAFSVLGTDLAWYSSMFVQHTAGVWNQMFDADRLLITNELGDNIWRFELYSGAMMDLHTIINNATAEEAWGYTGVAKILMAYSLGVTSDLWGQIPYSEAFLQSDNLKPSYDSQETIYNAIQGLLADGIADLGKGGSGPSSDDLIYGGSTANWIKAANALKAKYHNHLSKRDPQGSAQAALDAINAGAFEGSTDDMLFNVFGTTATAENPWYQFFTDRAQHAISQTMVTALTDLNDPRLPLFATPVPSGEIIGAPNGTADQDQSGEVYSRPYQSITQTTPLPLMTYIEQKFIEAEANFRLGNTMAANAAYEIAVTETLQSQGVSDPTAIADYTAQTAVFPGAADLTLEHIMTQKWLSQYLQQPLEAYVDWRRTDLPVLSHPRGDIPRRFPYPTSEFDFNSENVPATTINNGVWWDDGTED